MGKADGELLNTQTEASKVLEAALQQMDGFINGKLLLCNVKQWVSSSLIICFHVTKPFPIWKQIIHLLNGTKCLPWMWPASGSHENLFPDCATNIISNN